MRSLIVSAVVISATAFATLALAQTIDGTLDPQYGVALSTQTTQTQFGDNIDSFVDQSGGSELDAAYAFIADGVLHVFLSGNLTFHRTVEIDNVYTNLEVFFDSKPGGQNLLRANNPNIDSETNLNNMAGLSFDSDFEADYWLGCGAATRSLPLRANYAELPTAGGGAGYYLGTATPGGPGTLSGGTNPNGILATIDNRNVAGVTAGCGVSSGAGVTTGVELAIPLATIGNPAGCVKVCAFVNGGGHAYVSNQSLGPLPPGTCSLGPPSGVSFAAIAGNQYFVVCPAIITPARSMSWGRLKTIYR
jgi:hypothetical protein